MFKSIDTMEKHDKFKAIQIISNFPKILMEVTSHDLGFMLPLASSISLFYNVLAVYLSLLLYCISHEGRDIALFNVACQTKSRVSRT